MNNEINQIGYGWYQCECCPYGYHIDLDFVRYCESVSQEADRSGSIKRRKDRRRQRQSMEVLLGLTPPSPSAAAAAAAVGSVFDHNYKVFIAYLPISITITITISISIHFYRLYPSVRILRIVVVRMVLTMPYTISNKRCRKPKGNTIICPM